MQYQELARKLTKKNASYIMTLSKSVFWNGILLCFFGFNNVQYLKNFLKNQNLRHPPVHIRCSPALFTPLLYAHFTDTSEIFFNSDQKTCHFHARAFLGRLLCLWNRANFALTNFGFGCIRSLSDSDSSFKSNSSFKFLELHSDDNGKRRLPGN